jgi:CIC family chloride channel protein
VRILTNLQYKLNHSTTVKPIALAITVGLLAGIGSIVLRWLIRGVQWLFIDMGGGVGLSVGLPNTLNSVLAPAVGMVAVSWLVRRWAPEAQGHGVPEVQFAVRARGGRIRARVAGIKALASAISIGSGGSVGREGPIVQIGSSLGSTVGQVLGLGADEIRILVAGGAAGAIGSTFNAPIAGVLFAMEVVLGTFATRSLGLVVVASVAATAIAQFALGTQPAFQIVQEFALVSNWEFFLYLLLGVLTGVVALVYVRAIYGLEEFFNGWHTTAWVKALTGGLVVGLIGTFGSPHIFGVGHEGVELALAGKLTIGAMVALVVLKILATSITLGAGGSGGVFAPALFIGAMTGGAFGQVVGRIAPTVTAPAGAYALVGAAAVLAAATHAPMTAIVILFEMTGDYQIILPLMFSVVLSQLIASRINPDSIYSTKLRRLGGAFGSHTERSTLDFLLVADAMTDKIPSVRPNSELKEFAALARRTTDTRSWVVLERGDTVVGMVTLKDLEQAILESSLEDRTVADIMTTGLVTCHPGETLGEAFRRFSGRDVFQIPVIDPGKQGKIVGMLRRSEMLWAFKQLSDEHEQLLERLETLTDQPRSSSAYVELPVRPEHRSVCFHRIREIDLPEFALVAMIRRGERVVVPRGFLRVEPGDILTLITTTEHRQELEHWVVELYESPEGA